jgi:hypothetical protein
MKEIWTKAWPKKAGDYWFYGWRFGKSEHDPNPELSFVEVFVSSNGIPMYATRGHFLSVSEGAIGLWTKANLPKLPDLQDNKSN